MVNNIKDNTISEIDAKKRLNTLNKIKNLEIKYKRLIPRQKELLNLFKHLSDIILSDKTLISSKGKNQKLKEQIENNNENEDENEMRIRMRMRMKMIMKMKIIIKIKMKMKRKMMMKQWIRTKNPK